MKLKKDFDKYREDLIVHTMKDIGGECSINDVIEKLWSDTTNEEKIKAGWRFFVHINKFPARLEKQKRIKFTGNYKQGRSKPEKIWRVLAI